MNRKDLIEWAYAQVGYCEGNNNDNKYSNKMHEIQPWNMDINAPWCDAFNDCGYVDCYGVDNAKRLLCGDFDDYTPVSAQLFKDAGRYSQTPDVIPCQIFFRNSTEICHTGIVVAQDDEYVKTIEGNKNNCVRICFHKKDEWTIDGYGIPDWSIVEDESEMVELNWFAFDRNGTVYVIMDGKCVPMSCPDDWEKIQYIYKQATGKNIPTANFSDYLEEKFISW